MRPGIEFNFYGDPEAAAIVLERAESSNTSVTLVPMETVVDCELGVVSVMKLLLFKAKHLYLNRKYAARCKALGSPFIKRLQTVLG